MFSFVFNTLVHLRNQTFRQLLQYKGLSTLDYCLLDILTKCVRTFIIKLYTFYWLVTFGRLDTFGVVVPEPLEEKEHYNRNRLITNPSAQRRKVKQVNIVFPCPIHLFILFN